MRHASKSFTFEEVESSGAVVEFVIDGRWLSGGGGAGGK